MNEEDAGSESVEFEDNLEQTVEVGEVIGSLAIPKLDAAIPIYHGASAEESVPVYRKCSGTICTGSS